MITATAGSANRTTAKHEKHVPDGRRKVSLYMLRARLGLVRRHLQDSDPEAAVLGVRAGALIVRRLWLRARLQ